MAAHRAEIRTVILPKGNEKDMVDIPANIQEDLKLHFVEAMDEVLQIALECPLQPLAPNAPLAADFQPKDVSDQGSLTQ